MAADHEMKTEAWKNTQHAKSLIYVHDKTDNKNLALNNDSEQPRHSHSLIRVLAAHMKKAFVLSYSISAQQRIGSDWIDAWSDLSLRWV